MKVFISYSSDDIDIPKKLKGYLKNLNIDSFVASDDLRVASNWKESIISNLKDCSIFIPLLSKSFKSSDWCSQELGIAFIKEKKLSQSVLMIQNRMDLLIIYNQNQSKKII